MTLSPTQTEERKKKKKETKKSESHLEIACLRVAQEAPQAAARGSLSLCLEQSTRQLVTVFHQGTRTQSYVCLQTNTSAQAAAAAAASAATNSELRLRFQIHPFVDAAIPPPACLSLSLSLGTRHSVGLVSRPSATLRASNTSSDPLSCSVTTSSVSSFGQPRTNADPISQFLHSPLVSAFLLLGPIVSAFVSHHLRPYRHQLSFHFYRSSIVGSSGQSSHQRHLLLHSVSNGI